LVTPDFHACVALIRLKKTQDSLQDEIVFIKRSICEGDPWSGHCAFPGGGLEKTDSTLLDTAIRETKEEIGLSLFLNNNVSQVCSVKPKKVFNNKQLYLHCFEFETNKELKFFDASEVSDVFSIQIKEFFDDRNYRVFPSFDSGGDNLSFYLKENYQIWGLTLAILFEYFANSFPKLLQQLSFYSEYELQKNNKLEIYRGENISLT